MLSKRIKIMNGNPLVYIDVERMKYKNIGLFTFCEQLILALKGNFNYKYFGDVNVCSLKPKWYHKYFGVRLKDIDLWHATHQDTKYLPSSKIPVVLTIHDLNFLYTNKSKERKNKRIRNLQKLVDRSSYVVVISDYVLNDVKRHINLRSKPFKVIYNGTVINENIISSDVLCEEEFLFSLGTVVPKKNIKVLLGFIAKTNYKLIIAGVHSNANYLEEIKNEIIRLRLENKVVLTGAVSEQDKNWYYKNCKAFLFPSLSEGFGLPVIEAMRYGKPVFCSSLTSLPEIAGKEAFYFRSFDSDIMLEVFEKGMIEMKENPEKPLKIINWSKKYTWEKTANNYEEIYLEVLGSL